MEKNVTFESAGIARVRIKLTWAQLEIVELQGGAFQAIIAGDDESVQELRVEESSGELVISQPHLAYAKEIIPRRRWLQICLRVPGAWQGDIDADTVSGPIGAHTIQCADLTLATVTGAMNINDVRCKSLWMHTVSGAVAGQALRAEKASLRSVSGNMNVTDALFTHTKLFTVSGEAAISLLEGSRAVDMQSISGSSCFYVNSPVKAAFHALSGQFLLADDVEQADDGIEINASSVSGNFAVKRRDAL